MSADKPVTSNGGQLIQSTFGTPSNPGNFELIVLEPGGPNAVQLRHWWRDNSKTAQPWNLGEVISTAATDLGSIIQSSYGPGNLEVLVREGLNIRHYWRTPEEGSSWNPGVAFSGKATGPPSFIQGTYVGKPGQLANFDAVVLEENNLVHYWRNNSDPSLPWAASAVISTNAISPGSILESPVVGPGSPGPLNVVVQEPRGLVHYWRDDATFKWNSGEVIFPGYVPTVKFTPGAFLQSTFVEGPGAPGNFEFLLSTAGANPLSTISHYYRNNAAANLDWHWTTTIAPHAIAGGTIIQSSYGNEGSPGNFEAVFIVDPGNVVHYWRNNSNSDHPWSGPTFITKALGS